MLPLNDSDCDAITGRTTPRTPRQKIVIPDWQAIIVIVFFGVFFMLLAKLFDYIRRHAYSDKVSTL